MLNLFTNKIFENFYICLPCTTIYIYIYRLVILCCVVILFDFEEEQKCVEYLWIFNIGYIGVLVGKF